jgi:hypothetical protein
MTIPSREYMREYRNTQRWKDYMKAYAKTDKNKAYKKKYYSTPKWRKYFKDLTLAHHTARKRLFAENKERFKQLLLEEKRKLGIKIKHPRNNHD